MKEEERKTDQQTLLLMKLVPAIAAWGMLALSILSGGYFYFAVIGMFTGFVFKKNGGNWKPFVANALAFLLQFLLYQLIAYYTGYYPF